MNSTKRYDISLLGMKYGKHIISLFINTLLSGKSTFYSIDSIKQCDNRINNRSSTDGRSQKKFTEINKTVLFIVLKGKFEMILVKRQMKLFCG